jgi:hypothetical protein
MAHFAKLDENNKVLAVHVVNNDVITVDGIESEQAGINFLIDLYGHELWKQTSYNAIENGFRGNYAGIGYTYDPDFDVFIAPRPYPSWKLNYTNYQWESPVSMPEEIEGYFWKWSEINKEWIKVEAYNV